MILSIIFTILTLILSAILIYMGFITHQVNISIFMGCYFILSILALAEQIYTSIKLKDL